MDPRPARPFPDAEPTVPEHAERAYEAAVERHLPRNYVAHLIHGLLGQTGFRLLNAPTFLPAYVLLLSGGSDLAVGIALSAQALGTMITPLIGANLIAHRRRVLPVGFAIGAAMRGMVLLIALAGLVLPETLALPAIVLFLLGFGLFNGMQGVMFNFLMSKIIPVRRRGRLTGLRNFLAGITSALVAGAGGVWLVGDTPDPRGYSLVFLVAFLLTSCGLLSLLLVREPEPPSVKPRASLADRLGELPGLLQGDPAFTRYFLARSVATLGRMAVPFYVVYAGVRTDLDGTALGWLTVAFTLAGTVSNLLWGLLADRFGFRSAFLGATALWAVATALLMAGDGLAVFLVVFGAIGAAFQGFQHASINLTLEFGHRDDLPLRIAVANTGSEFAGALGPLLGGVLAALLGYEAVFWCSMAFLVVGGLTVYRFVPEPRAAVGAR